MARLSIVGTPIGNLEDITLRALRTLSECDVIYAEDTRVISKLLSRYEIQKPLQRLDAATEGAKASAVIERLERGEHVAFVSDAGTPGISDPGARLVAAIRQSGVEAIIESIPGPSSLTAALSIAGVQADTFLFLGFLPHKKGRATAIREIADASRPVVLFESPHRIRKLLGELQEACGERRIIVARELTKIHEEVLAGISAEIADALEKGGKERGEFVVIVDVERARGAVV